MRVWSTLADRKKILVVDDDVALLNFVRILLSEDYLVETASNGFTAVRLAETFAPDLIVLDLRMPGMDGRSVYGELRDRKVSSKFLILSAYGAAEARRELGAEAHLDKPFRPDRLLSLVQSTLG
jgi:DNA-binding response OmpR family regulator